MKKSEMYLYILYFFMNILFSQEKGYNNKSIIQEGQIVMICYPQKLTVKFVLGIVLNINSSSFDLYKSNKGCYSQFNTLIVYGQEITMYSFKTTIQNK